MTYNIKPILIKGREKYDLIHKDHNKDIFDINKIEEMYEAEYLLETCLVTKEGSWANFPASLFYQENPDVEKGHTNYFAIYMCPLRNTLCITKGDRAVKDVTYSGIFIPEAQSILYSAFRHDFQTFKTPDEEYLIDGGRDYTKTSNNAGVVNFKIVDNKIEII